MKEVTFFKKACKMNMKQLILLRSILTREVEILVHVGNSALALLAASFASLMKLNASGLVINIHTYLALIGTVLFALIHVFAVSYKARLKARRQIVDDLFNHRSKHLDSG